METNKILEELENLIDVKKLKQSDELKSPIEDESQRQLVDAAKKRAAAQNVDYPCFAALVTCAHLKPMIRKEMDNNKDPDHQRQNKSTPAWSFDISGHLQPDIVNKGIYKHVQSDITKYGVIKMENAKSEISSPCNGSQFCFENPIFQDDEPKFLTHYNSEVLIPSMIFYPKSLQTKIIDIPSPFKIKTSIPTTQGLLCSSDNFIKEWRLHSALHSSERLRFIRKFSPSSFSIIFKIEIPPFLLQELLELLCNTILTVNKGLDGREEEKEKEKVNFLMTNNHNQKTALDYCYSGASTRSNEVTHTNNESDVDNSISNAVDSHLSSKEIRLAPNDDDTIVQWVASTLSHLTKCGRFGLAVKLVGKQSQHRTSKLINYVYATISDPNMFLVLTNGTRLMDLLVSYNCI